MMLITCENSPKIMVSRHITLPEKNIDDLIDDLSPKNAVPSVTMAINNNLI